MDGRQESYTASAPDVYMPIPAVSERNYGTLRLK